jgi:hypothetical protein
MKKTFYALAIVCMLLFILPLTIEFLSKDYLDMPTKIKGWVVVDKYPKNIIFGNMIWIRRPQTQVCDFYFVHDIVFDKIKVGDTIK